MTESYLAGLNTAIPLRAIGRLESTEFPYTIYSLQSKSELEKEGSTLGHCVGDSDFYIEKYLRGEMLVLSLRDDAGIPHWTLEYNRENAAIHQFK